MGPKILRRISVQDPRYPSHLNLLEHAEVAILAYVLSSQPERVFWIGDEKDELELGHILSCKVDIYTNDVRKRIGNRVGIAINPPLPFDKDGGGGICK